MRCIVYRTHKQGIERTDFDPAPAVEGQIRMYSVVRQEQGRYVQVLTLESLAYGGRTVKSPIPDLLDPAWIAFSSRTGMLVCGTEEVDGQAYEQTWRVVWSP